MHRLRGRCGGVVGGTVVVVLSSDQRNQSHQIASHVHQNGEDVVVVFLLIIACDQTQSKSEDEDPDDEPGPDTRREEDEVRQTESQGTYQNRQADFPFEQFETFVAQRSQIVLQETTEQKLLGDTGKDENR